MLCWPVYIVGGFFISLLMVDIYQYSWDILPFHAGIGIFFTGLYYLFCLLFGNDISMAVLFVPGVFISMFFLTTWLFYNNAKHNNCCMTCNIKGDTSKGNNTSDTTPMLADMWNSLFTDPPKKCN